MSEPTKPDLSGIEPIAIAEGDHPYNCTWLGTVEAGDELYSAATVEQLVQERNEWKKVADHLQEVREVLEKQLAAMTQERNAAKSLTIFYSELAAASQAYAAQLREAYYKLPRRIAEYAFGSKDQQGSVSIGSAYLCVERAFSRDGIEPDEALSLPQDDTALREWGAKLLEDIECGADSAYEIMCRVSRKAAELRAAK